ncbi:hypothetical protein HN51_062434, partial [Arachis hypogaea]
MRLRTAHLTCSQTRCSSHPIILEALESGQLSPGGIIIEGSASSTAISITMVAPAFACKSHVIIPNDATIENIALGATVEREKNPRIKCFLIDPPGSSLYNKIVRLMKSEDFLAKIGLS